VGCRSECGGGGEQGTPTFYTIKDSENLDILSDYQIKTGCIPDRYFFGGRFYCAYLGFELRQTVFAEDKFRRFDVLTAVTGKTLL